ncbi:hypothetical protein [Streptomyces anulatus]|uniref:hypothetical protein n=1 Tax=Streptomyces anulatus TaxID=1892 RepID=UPI0004C81F61|nr:hypothetical protein [Streptomyces anulatus]
MDLTEALDKAVAALKAPLEPTDRAQGWTDDLRREIQEEISIHRSTLRRHGHWMVTYLRPRLDAWMAGEGVRPGRLRDVVMNVQTLISEPHDAADSRSRP